MSVEIQVLADGIEEAVRLAEERCAAEIQRLREALREIRDGECNDRVHEIARRALAGE